MLISDPLTLSVNPRVRGRVITVSSCLMVRCRCCSHARRAQQTAVTTRGGARQVTLASLLSPAAGGPVGLVPTMTSVARYVAAVLFVTPRIARCAIVTAYLTWPDRRGHKVF